MRRPSNDLADVEKRWHSRPLFLRRRRSPGDRIRVVALGFGLVVALALAFGEHALALVADTVGFLLG